MLLLCDTRIKINYFKTMNKIFLFLNKYTNIGYVGFTKILNYLDNDLDRFFELKENDFLSLGFNIKNIYENIKKYSYERDLEELNKLGIRICNIFDNNYPYLLKNIADPPLMFYYKGTLIEKENNLAIVGSRKPSAYGQRVAKEFSSYLSNCFSIVSGFANGVDSISHNEAVVRGKRTIAIMGVGLDILYPDNKELADRILENNGLLISEFPIGVRPMKSNFPKRNRIISGISLGVLVVEAGIKSGTSITAGFALEQGRDLFVIPGSIYSEFSEGTNDLIKKGANFVTKPEDVIEILNAQFNFFKITK